MEEDKEMNLFSIRKKILRKLIFLAPSSYFRKIILILCGYKIGKNTGIGAGFYVYDRSKDRNNLIIGKNCAIAANLKIITTSSPKESLLSELYGTVYKPVKIRDNVWIGTNVTILPGITIGKCSIVSAGTIVDKDIPNYSVAKGNPMKIKKMNNYLISKIKKIEDRTIY